MKLFRKVLILLASTSIVVMFLILSNSPVTAQPPPLSWTQLSPAGSPPTARYSAGASAYDEANDRLILFSGEDSSGLPRPTDVWVLVNASGANGTPSWLQLTPQGGPPLGRFGGTVVYDPVSNRIVVHGGCTANCSPGRRDTWILTNANGLGGTPTWVQLPDAPLVRAEHAAVFDSANNRMIVFGGHQAFFNTDRNDVWILTDANGIGSPAWIPLSPSGTPPPPRRDAAAVYDQATNRLIIFGGAQLVNCCTLTYDFDDVWVLTNANGLGGTPEWIQLAPTGTLPTPRFSHSLAYDSDNNQAIAFGGINFTNAPNPFNEVWILTYANGIGGTPQWTQVTPNGSLPLGRTYHSVGYSHSSKRMIIAMGRNDTATPSLFNDAWALVQDTTPPDLSLPADLTVEGNTTNGANVTLPSVTASDDFDPAPIVNCDQDSGFFPLGSTTVNCTATDASGNGATGSFNVTVMDTISPDITCPPDINETVGQPISLGSPFVSDIVDPSPDITNDAPASYPPGITTVVWTAMDASGNDSTCSQKVSLIYNFSGFFAPIDNPPVVNSSKAGKGIPIKFSLNGNQGLDILADGYPVSQQVVCDLLAPANDILETDTAGNSQLSYDADKDQYNYVWKTEKGWSGCRQLIVRLDDGTEHDAVFEFK